MKNVHLLPTDAPSRLYISQDTNKLILNWNYLYNSVSKNIYITSDEEIKEDDWVLSKLNEVILFGRSYSEKFYKKIILTTDQDLIADGIQAIDDEFLEWFVKNPSCESVDVKEGYFHGSGYYDANQLSEQEKVLYSLMKKYKITIPKQETIGEAAERIFNIPYEKEGDVYFANNIAHLRKGFKFCAKWQAERSFSEEQVIELLEYVRTNFYDTGKHWHQEPDKDFTSKELFEQFKNKC